MCHVSSNFLIGASSEFRVKISPCKIFSIGQVFRKENIDSTHLPEFYQIEGIIHEENTNFRQLIGVLKEFYERIGFKKIRFRPAYFPYTEPIGIKDPVLAWGLGLERLAMLKFDLKDIRDLYISDLDWLRHQSIV